MNINLPPSQPNIQAKKEERNAYMRCGIHLECKVFHTCSNRLIPAAQKESSILPPALLRSHHQLYSAESIKHLLDVCVCFHSITKVDDSEIFDWIAKKEKCPRRFVVFFLDFSTICSSTGGLQLPWFLCPPLYTHYLGKKRKKHVPLFRFSKINNYNKKKRCIEKQQWIVG